MAADDYSAHLADCPEQGRCTYAYQASRTPRRDNTSPSYRAAATTRIDFHLVFELDRLFTGPPNACNEIRNAIITSVISSASWYKGQGTSTTGFYSSHGDTLPKIAAATSWYHNSFFASLLTVHDKPVYGNIRDALPNRGCMNPGGEIPLRWQRSYVTEGQRDHPG